MRYVKIRITPREGAAFHPLGRELAEEPSVTRDAIHRVEILDDGTGVMLAEARGDRERYEEILQESEFVIEYAVTGAEGSWYSYTHFEPTDLTHRMMEARTRSEVMMEMPIRVHEDGSFDITFVGDQRAFADAMPAENDVYDTELLEMGERAPKAGDFFACLTERQREVLEAALERGYYENPRRATQEEIAAVVGASPSTVGEHLRKIEARVFSQFTG